VPKLNRPLVVGASSLATYRDCHEKYRNRYVELLIPKKPESKRSFGTAFHAAVDTYYRTEDVDKAETAFVAIAKEADLPLTMDSDEPRSMERGLALFNAWLTRWKNEPFRLLRRPDGTPFTEIRGTIPLFEHNGFPVVYSFTIDKIVEAGGRIYIPDVKTTRRSLSQFQNSMRPNHQLTGYFAGAKQVLGDKVFAVGYDAIFISTRQPNPKKGGWWAHGIDIDKDFMRSFSTRSQRDIDIWYDMTIRDTQDLIRDIEAEREAPWSMNAPAACSRYGRCDYMDSCIHNQDPIVISSLFQKEDWKPYADSRLEWEVDENAGT
jgi:hypothetical protein